MNREDTIKLAIKAGIKSPDLYKLTVSHMSIETLHHFAEIVAASVKADERDVGAIAALQQDLKTIQHELQTPQNR